MVKGLFLLVILALLLVACVPGDPAVVTVTPVPTDAPTPVPDYFEPVNPYSDLSGAFYVWAQPKVMYCTDPRHLVIPHAREYVGSTACMTPPHMTNVGMDDFKFEVDNIGRPLDENGLAVEEPGGFGYGTAVEHMYPLPAGRYVYVAKFASIALDPLPTAQIMRLPDAMAQGVWYDWNVSAYVKLYASDGRSAIMGPVTFPRSGQDVELVIGVVENDTWTLARDVFTIDIIHRIVGGTIVLTDLELQAVPPDYGDDAVVGLR
jgi:hypothetical protein